jgi:hypothetical protein
MKPRPTMRKKRLKVWECKIVVPSDAVLPNGFDALPRRAAMRAVTDAGIPIISCFSGWGARLTRGETGALIEQAAKCRVSR